MSKACGIDFGTSNSTVGWGADGRACLLPLEDDKLTLPSAVFFNAEENNVSFGRAALAGYLTGYEGRLMRSMKSLLGTSLIDGQTEVLGKALPFRSLLEQFIGELKRRAELAAGRPFQQAVFGRPVFFIDGNPAADRQAEATLAEIAHAVGFQDVAFQFEPIAAAFDYESRVEREELVLVVDIGGGTSDFSLVRLAPGRAAAGERRDDILANGGVHIGGTDFDKYLSLASAMPLLGLGSRMLSGGEIPSSVFYDLATWHTINFAYTPKIQTQLRDIRREASERDKIDRLLALVEQREGHWLAHRMEEGKIALSGQASVVLELERLTPKDQLTIGRDQFEEAISHLIASIEQTVLEVLRTAEVQASDVDTVFFTGGSSGVQLLRERISALLPEARRVEGDLFGSIGTGLSLDAMRRFA